MVFERTRKRVLIATGTTYICGRFPLLHLILLLIEMALVARLFTRFDCYYTSHPVFTMMVTNALLNGIADTVAQSVSSIRLAVSRKPDSGTNIEPAAIEFHELDRKNSLPPDEFSSDSQVRSANFDFERLARFAAYGFMMAAPQYKWFQFLSKTFPTTKQSGLGSTLKMVAFDQLIFAPIGVALFFTVMTIAEGGGRRAVSSKLRDMYIPTIKANYMVWPLAQIINFRFMPIQFQLPFASTIGIAWTAYLSLSNASEETGSRSAPQSPNARLLS